MSYAFPSNREVSEIGPIKVARMSAQRVGFTIMPFRNVPESRVEWTQKDNFKGLQQLRGLDGKPAHVQRRGTSRFSYEPGVFGEVETIGETELTKRSGGVMTDIPIDVSDLVMEAQDSLIQRELDRQESIIFTLAITGTFTITSADGSNSFTDTFAVQTYAGSDWSTVATATPFADFRAACLLGVGKGIRLDASATAYMNRITANNMLNNTNAGDIGGKRIEGGANFLSLSDMNKWLVANDLPQVQIYDEAYLDDSNTLQRFIPTDKVLVVGSRVSGEAVGEYLLTRNANNPGYAPGSYDYVEDHTGNGPNGLRHVPANINVHRGHNGGPALYFPSALIVMSV